MRKRRLGLIFIIILLGALAGTALGEVVSLLLPDGVVKDFFIRSAGFSFGPATFDLAVITFTLGLSLKINFIGVFGIILVAYLLRWLD